MNRNIKLIQLFDDEYYHSTLKEHMVKIKCNIICELLPANTCLSDNNLFHYNSVFLVDKSVLQVYADNMAELSVFNEIIFVYKSEDEVLDCVDVGLICNQFVPYEFSYPLIKTILSKYFTSEENKKVTGPKLNLNIGNAGQIIHDFFNAEYTSAFIKNKKLKYCLINNHFLDQHNLNTLNNSKILSDADVWDDKISEIFLKQDEHILSTGKPLKGEIVEFTTNNGCVKQLLIDKFPLKDRSGNTWFILGSYKEITITKPSNETIFTDEKLLQILMDNITDTIYFKDIDSRFIRINKAQAKLIGVKSPEDAIGKTDFDYFNIEHSRKAQADELRIIASGLPMNSIEYIGTKDGKFCWVSASKVPLIDKSGKVIGTVGITRDIDNMVRVEHRLKAERDLLQLLIDHIPSPIYFKDCESKFTRVNLAQAKVLGARSSEDVIGKSDFDFYSKDDAYEFFNDEKWIIDNRKPVINKIEECFPPGEGMRWFSTTKIPIKNEDGELSGIVGVSHDITDQILVKKDLEHAIEKAEVASTAKSNFLSNMSHEIRTPMNGVIGMAEVLNMTDLDVEQKKIVSLIIRSGNNLLNIINDILDFSKIENGKMLIESEPIDIYSIVREVCEMLIFSASEKNIHFSYKVDSNIPELVKGDSLRLKQVLINLISNAIKFTKVGEVSVEANFIGNTDNTHCIIFKVIDTGIGIGKDEKQYLFDAFTQADASTSRKYGGTGLGLAISSRLVTMMGGKLDIISEKGKGSTFFFDVCFDKIVYEDSDTI